MEIGQESDSSNSLIYDQVALIDVKEDVMSDLKSELGVDCIAVPADLSSPEGCANACETIRRKLGDPSVLVHSAGILSNNKTASTTAQEWRKVMVIICKL